MIMTLTCLCDVVIDFITKIIRIKTTDGKPVEF